MTSDEYYDECRATAALYAVGALAHEEATQFEERLRSECPLCRAEYDQYAEVADCLAISVPVHDPAPSLRDKLLERVRRAGGETAAGVSQMTLARAFDARWVPSPVPDVEIRPLLGQRTLLVRMQPGTVYPAHEHPQAEQCYVLEGSITDSEGLTVWAGDYICMPAGSTHSAIHSDNGCLLLIAYTPD